MSEPVTTKKQTSRARLLGILGGVAGWAVGQYSGFALLIPLAIAGLIWAIGRKAVHGDRQIVFPAFAVQAGYLGWFIVGIVVSGQLGTNAIDLVVFGAGLAWLLLSPGRIVLFVLAGLQMLALLVNGYAISQAEWGTPAHRALTVHIALRITAIGLNLMAAERLSQTDTKQSAGSVQ